MNNEILLLKETAKLKDIVDLDFSPSLRLRQKGKALSVISRMRQDLHLRRVRSGS